MTVETADRHSAVKKRITFLLLSAAFGALAVWLLWQFDPSVENWIDRFQRIVDYLENRPWALFIALAILPGFAFPSSILLVFFSITLSPKFGMPMTCLLAVCALSICTTWTYLLSIGPLRNTLKLLLSKRMQIPEPSDTNMLRLGFVFRLTPGIPYALQNVVLGILGMRLRPYLLVSLPINAMWTIAFVLTSGAIFEGRAGLAISGILLIIVLIITTKMLLRRTKANAR